MDKSGQLAAALLKWSTFPVDQKPRPTILTGDPVQAQGFTTSGAKNAFMDGNVRSNVPLPPGVLDRLLVGHQAAQGIPLVISAASRTSAQFGTDRGDRIFPAWQLTIPDTLGPIIVLDPAIQSWWPPQEQFSAAYGATSDITADGLTLTYRFHGSPSRYYSISSATAVETDTAIVVDVAMQLLKIAPQVIPLSAEQRTVAVTLTKPLGDRVLIDAAGRPISVVNSQGEGRANQC